MIAQPKLQLPGMLGWLMILLTVIVAAAGLFDDSGTAPYHFINQYGDHLRIYGHGLYRNDSLLRATIFKGTDCTMLFAACPLLAWNLLRRQRAKAMSNNLMRVSLNGCFLYYAAGLVFGVHYNSLQLLYIMLFAVSFYACIIGIASPADAISIKDVNEGKVPFKGIYVFLSLTGIALFVAWLPDIISDLLSKRPLLLIENYTTEITYVLDMGIIAPLCFITIYLLKKRSSLGYILLHMISTLCILMGLMRPVQSLFQLAGGVVLPLPVVLTKIGSFVLLAAFAFYLESCCARLAINLSQR